MLSPGDDPRTLDCGDMGPAERAILGDPANDIRVLCLSGPLIFGAASALNRQQNRLADARTLIIDLTQVPHLGVTSSLALETTIREVARRRGRIFVAGLQDQPRERFGRLGMSQVVPPERWAGSRAEAPKGHGETRRQRGTGRSAHQRLAKRRTRLVAEVTPTRTPDRSAPRHSGTDLSAASSAAASTTVPASPRDGSAGRGLAHPPR